MYENIEGDGVEIGMDMGSGNIKWIANDGSAELKCRILGDVEVDAEIGRERGRLRLLGRIVDGIVATLTNANGSWSWGSK